MGMVVSVFRDDLGDCSANGLSSKFDKVTVVNCEGPFEPSADRPAVKMEFGNIAGTVKVVPVGDEYKDRHSMFGGTFVYSSDSRFAKKCAELTGLPFWSGAVPFHDRYEG